MAHFAELNRNNTVLRVVVINNGVLLDENNEEQESLGVAYCQELYGNLSRWKQTSYNSSMRRNFAQRGMFYYEEHDIFVEPNPYPGSWSFNAETYEWQPPIPKPQLTEQEILDGKQYFWNVDCNEWTTNPDELNKNSSSTELEE